VRVELATNSQADVWRVWAGKAVERIGGIMAGDLGGFGGADGEIIDA
jgi:hypothetical protein